MSLAYVASRTLEALREAAAVAGAHHIIRAGHWLARGARALRRLLPGVRCEAQSVCLARGGYSISRYEGDSDGGYSICRLHAELFAAELAEDGEYAVIVQHTCTEVCDHTIESEWV